MDFTGYEVWEVASKKPPLEAAELTFIQGKTVSVSLSLFSSESPDTVRFVDALQSAVYNSSNPASNAEAEASMRGILSKAGDEKLSDAQLAANVQMDAWKLNNQRFGIAQITASQSHDPSGDIRLFSITIGGRSFSIRLLGIPGGRTMIDLSEIKQ